MILKRDRDNRGITVGSWLVSKHTFSFGRYYDAENMGFGPLRVINEDRITPGAGFKPHCHENMEILTWVLSGQISHRDSAGNIATLGAGDIQLLSAGRGIEHSELNASKDEELHLLQVWILPNESNTSPQYQQQKMNAREMSGLLRLLAAPGGGEGVLSLRQEARIFAARLDVDEVIEKKLAANRKYWVHFARGEAELNGEQGRAGDGFAVEGESLIRVSPLEETEMLLFELPR